MSKGCIRFSNNNEYYTPKYIINIFGKFDYDPATIKEKADEFNIKYYDTIESDGLNKEWNYKKIWINPPFTLKKDFLIKAYETYKKYHNDIYILLPIETLTTKFFHDNATGGTIYLPNRRIKFESDIGVKSETPAFGSIILNISDTWNIKLLNIVEEGDIDEDTN